MVQRKHSIFTNYLTPLNRIHMSFIDELRSKQFFIYSIQTCGQTSKSGGWYINRTRLCFSCSILSEVLPMYMFLQNLDLMKTY